MLHAVCGGCVGRGSTHTHTRTHTHTLTRRRCQDRPERVECLPLRLHAEVPQPPPHTTSIDGACVCLLLIGRSECCVLPASWPAAVTLIHAGTTSRHPHAAACTLGVQVALGWK